MLGEELDVVKLLKKVQESTTSDIDEEKGSFKVGDVIIYNTYGSGLTNSDSIRLLGIDEHSTRLNHHEKQAKITEAEGDKVIRYNIEFDDGFVVNGVTMNELKRIREQTSGLVRTILDMFEDAGYEVDEKELESYIKSLSDEDYNYLEQALAEGDEEKAMEVLQDIPLKKKAIESKTNEATKVPQTMQPQEKPNINAEDYHMEDYSEEDLEKVKSKSPEAGHGIRNIADDELKQVPDKVVKPKKESKSTFTKQKSLWLCNSCCKTFRSDKDICERCQSKDVEKIIEIKGEVGLFKHVYQVGYELDGKKSSIRVEAFDKSDAEETAKRLRKGAIVTGTKKISEGKNPQQLRMEEISFKPTKTNEAAEFLVLKNASISELLHNLKGWEKRKELGDVDTNQAEFEISKLKKELARRDKIKEQIKKLSEEGWFYKAVDKLKEDPEFNRLVKEYGAKSNQVHQYVAKQEGEKTSKSIIDDLITHATSDVKESKLTETVLELVGEVPELTKEDVQILRWAVRNNIISNEWPSNKVLITELQAKLPEEEKEKLETAEDIDLRALYLQYVLLPEAKKAWSEEVEKKTGIELESKVVESDRKEELEHALDFVNSRIEKEGELEVWVNLKKNLQDALERERFAKVKRESKLQEQEKDIGVSLESKQIKETDKTRKIGDKVWIAYRGKHGRAEGKISDVMKVKPGWDLLYEIEILDDRDPFRKRGEKVLVFDEEIDDIENIPESKINEDVYVGDLETYILEEISSMDVGLIQIIVQLTSGSLTKVNKLLSMVEEELKYRKKKQLEKRIKEQEKDTYTTIAKGIVDKTEADRIARDKKGMVVADEEDPKKFQIIVKEAMEYKPKVMRSKMIDIMYDLGYHLDGERKEDEFRILTFKKGEDTVEVKLFLEEEKD